MSPVGAGVKRALRYRAWLSPLFGVFGEQIAERDSTAAGLGREPLGKVSRKDDSAVHAVVALPAFVT